MRMSFKYISMFSFGFREYEWVLCRLFLVRELKWACGKEFSKLLEVWYGKVAILDTLSLITRDGVWCLVTS